MLSLIIMLSGCTPTTGEVETKDQGQDTGAVVETGETDEPVADLTIWSGERVFVTDDCEEPAIEEGHELTAENWDYYQDYHDTCPNCDYIYYVDVGPETVCGYPVTQVRYRGVDFTDEGKAIVYNFSTNSPSAEVLDPDASFDGWTLTYEYDHNSSLGMRGTVNYPEAE